MSRVKICGLSRMEDIDAANGALPDYVGFVFAPSRRQVDEKTAAMLKDRLNVKIKSVGVFVNQDAGSVSYLYKNGIIDLAQLHGDEDGQYIERLKESCGCPVIRSIGIGGTLPHLPYLSDYFMFDTFSNQRGGVGKTFDWKLIKDFKIKPYFLAGGLTVQNVTNAIEYLNPFCVDVSSGVETDEVKDPVKILEFVRRVRESTACCLS